MKGVFERFKQLFIENKTSIIVTVLLSLCFNWIFITEGVMCPDAYSEGYDLYLNASWAGTLGRWALRYWNGLTHNVVILSFNYLISIVCIVVSSLMIIDMLNLRNRWFSFLTMLSIALAPAVSYQYLYGYMEMAFAFGLLFSVLAVWLFVHNKNILGALSLCLSLGSYQAYIGFAVTLILIILVRRLNSNENIRSILPDFAWYLFFGIAGCVLYILLNKINLMVYGLQMASYGGANQISIGHSISMLGDSISKCYMATNKFVHYPNTFRYAAILVAGIFLCVLINRNSYLNKFIIIVLIILLPVAMNCVSIIAPDKSIAKQMLHQMILVLPLLFVIVETENINDKLVKYGSVFSVVICLILCFEYGIINYCSQATLNNAQKKVMSLMSTAISTAVSDENYGEDSVIFFAEVYDKEMLQEEDPLSEFSIYHDDVVCWNYKGAVIYLYNEFSRDKLGYDLGTVSEADYDRIVNSEEFKQMPVYPAFGGMKRFDNIYVVKMEEDPPLE